jgi:hypothetical protein
VYQGNSYYINRPVRGSQCYREERHDHAHQQSGDYYDNRREFAGKVNTYLKNRRIDGFSETIAATLENINSLSNKPGVYEIAFWQMLSQSIQLSIFPMSRLV